MANDADSRAEIEAVIDGADGLLVKLMATLSPDSREALLSLATLRSLQAGDVILEDGKIAHEIGYLVEGVAGMIQSVDQHRRHIVGLLVPTDIYGRMLDGPSSYRIEALTPARILCFPGGPFEEVLHRYPDVERLFLVHLLDEMDAAREWLLLISGRKMVERVASFLMILARRARAADRGGPIIVRNVLSRKDLAQYLGTRKETLSRAFHELEAQGVIRILTPETFEVPDLQALTDACGNDLDAGEE
ncbi:helix-turn-helix domain-containing protein [bacterium]|nr:helix-turn-helix domain-containing protein [bacterium]